MPLNVRRHAASWPAITAGALWLLLTFAVWRESTLGLDAWLHAQFPDLSVAELITYAGDPVVILLLAVSLVVVLMRWREWEAARFVAGTFLAVALFRWAVVWQLERERPDDGLMAAFGYSYPSGHTAYSATAAAVIALLAIESRRSVLLVLIAWPAIVGTTRVAVGVHWATDVIGGLLLAIAVVSVVCRSHPIELTAVGYRAKTVRRQLHSLPTWGSRSKSGADPQR